MNKQEAIKLLALIKVAYPTAYRDLDEATKIATVNMWQMSFPNVPYPIMEQAFNHFRMVSKFAPTVADMVGELKEIHREAEDGIVVHRQLGNEEGVRYFLSVMECTGPYTDEQQIRRLQAVPKMLSQGGE